MFRMHFALIVAACMASGSALGHEFWIEPATYQIKPGEPMVAQLKNGQKFVGTNLIYFDRRFSRFDLIQGDTVLPVPGRTGDVPAVTVPGPEDGLWVIVHETTPSQLTYKTWEKFQTFADHKGFGDIRARHTARGLPEAGFAESYTRHVKALVAVGDGQGSDVNAGLETEFVALANPYTEDMQAGLPIQLFYQGQPRAHAQVEIFDRAPAGTVAISLSFTDAEGRANIAIEPGHTYLLDAVVLRPAQADSGAVWETLWAGLTFSVP